MQRMNIMPVFGTRPEAIKMAPVINELKRHTDCFRLVVVSTAQHRDMTDQMLKVFDIEPDYDLNIMSENQQISDVTVEILKRLGPVIQKENVDTILVQGDTTTAFASSLVAFYHKVSIGHIEAGLRTQKKYYPFPEEMNRRLISSLGDVHFAPTPRAQANLLKEGVAPDSIRVTGNTVIDALFSIVKRRKSSAKSTTSNQINILVTAHRRENFGRPMEEICKAILDIVAQHPSVCVIFPVHPNPKVRQTTSKYLAGSDRIKLTEPLNYLDFIDQMAESTIILTDSGGIQEEGPSLGKPILVLRNETERYEAIEAGTCILVGTERKKIVGHVQRLIEDRDFYSQMAHAVNPYGDGNASKRIASYFFQKLRGFLPDDGSAEEWDPLITDS